jgi:hypothetical protein
MGDGQTHEGTTAVSRGSSDFEKALKPQGKRDKGQLLHQKYIV